MRDLDTLSENKKIFSMHELNDMGFSQYRVRKLVEKGRLVKLNKSYYENNSYCGEESDFYYVEAFVPHGVICLLSAAVFYNLTVYVPDAIDVAIPRKSNVSKIPAWPQMNVYHFTDDRYSLGITRVQEGENRFQIYDLEKTVVDVVFYREKVGIEETKEILINYLSRKERNLNQLLRYAEQMKCENAMRKYLEVLL